MGKFTTHRIIESQLVQETVRALAFNLKINAACFAYFDYDNQIASITWNRGNLIADIIMTYEYVHDVEQSIILIFLQSKLTQAGFEVLHE